MNAARQPIRVSVGDDPIDAVTLVNEVGRPDSGATVLFLGTVRDHSNSRSGVTHLEYEVYAELVEPKIREIVEEASGRWPILSAVVEHRSGTVNLGEASVAVAVSSAHREDAFATARFIIDELKTRAPIWKKEHRPGGSEWSGLVGIKFDRTGKVRFQPILSGRLPRGHRMTTVLERAGAPSADVGLKTPPAYVREWAQDRPDLVAMREKDFGIWQEITWSQYWESVLEAAHGLLALGVYEGDRVSIHSEDRPEWVILDMATVAVRAITVGLYPTNPAAEVEYLLSDSGAVVHLAEDQEQADKVMAVISSLPDLRKIIHIEPRGFRKWRDDERFVSWDDFLKLGRSHREANPRDGGTDHGAGDRGRRDHPGLHLGDHRAAERRHAHQLQLCLQRRCVDLGRRSDPGRQADRSR